MSGILYFDCASGISGDMTIGALLDLGADRNKLLRAVESLGIDGYELKFDRVKKNGIDAFSFDVMLTQHHAAGHHGGEHIKAGHHVGEDGGHGDSGHGHRHLSDIIAIIDRGSLTPRAAELSKKMFEIVAAAEAKAHGADISQVHFHEVGAVDSIIDIVGTAVCIDDLDPECIIVSALSEGQGYVNCAHGTLPVPVPATANIAAAHGLKLRITETQGEMVTPTGAAIAAALSSGRELPGEFTIERIGIGAGTREYENPNVLRVMLLRPAANSADTVTVLETNIDDCTPEAMGFVMDALLNAGARDVYFTGIQMKKSRPGVLLTVICTPEDREKMENIIFTHTTTIGIRYGEVKRSVLHREKIEFDTELGRAGGKVISGRGVRRFVPEYGDVSRIAREKDMAFDTVYTAVKREGEKHV